MPIQSRVAVTVLSVVLAACLVGRSVRADSYCPDFDDFPEAFWTMFENRTDDPSWDEAFRMVQVYEETRQPEILTTLGYFTMMRMSETGWDQNMFEQVVRYLNNGAYCGNSTAMELLVGIHENDTRGNKAKPNLAICLREGYHELRDLPNIHDDRERRRRGRIEAARRARACGIWPMTDPPTITDDSPPRP